MWSYRYSPPCNDWLAHFGIKGQKWGFRRFQNEDGTLTEEGKERYNNSAFNYKKDEYGIRYANANDRKGLDELYNNSVVTKEGINLKNSQERKMLIDFLENRFGIDTKNVGLVTINGKDMNKIYGLTGQNAYRDDFHLLAITGLPFGEKLDNFKISMGCRWFDDIVDNNARREEKK